MIWAATQVAALVVGTAFGLFIIYFFVTQIRKEIQEEEQHSAGNAYLIQEKGNDEESENEWK